MGSLGGRIRYVALGDSYTIGTSVAEHERWPNQLVERMPGLDLVANLGVNGYTSRDVIDRELPRLNRLRPDFASLLVGVNDVVQRVPVERFRANAAHILDFLLGPLSADRVVVVTTPDYTVTPQGASYGEPAAQRAGIIRTNTILAEFAGERAIRVVDIFDLSRRAADDRSLVARDGLHPSGSQYRLWVDRIAPAVEQLLARARPPDPVP